MEMHQSDLKSASVDLHFWNFSNEFGENLNNSDFNPYFYDYETFYFKHSEGHGVPDISKWILLSLNIIVAVVSVFGNITTCVAYKRRTIPNTKTNFFITVISVNDIVHALCQVLLVISDIACHKWVYLPFMCPLFVYPQAVTVNFRAFLLVVLTIDKHIAVCRPINTNRRRRCGFPKAIVASTLVVSSLISLPSAMYTKISYITHGGQSREICLEMWEDPDGKYIYSVVMMIMQYFLPVFVMGVSYTHVIVILQKHRIPGEAIPQRDARLMTSKKQVNSLLIYSLVVT